MATEQIVTQVKKQLENVTDSAHQVLLAGLVPRAEDWPWSSLRGRLQPPFWPFVDAGPYPCLHRPIGRPGWRSPPASHRRRAT